MSNEGVGRRSSILTKTPKKDEQASMQGIVRSGVYFSNGKSKLVRTIDIRTSQGFIASSSLTDRPFVSNPQFAPNDVAGGDPGGDPAGPPLPLKDNLIILLLLSIIYVIKKSRLK